MTISLRNVVVTGAASGLGMAITSLLARQGVGVTCIDVNKDRLSEHVETLRPYGARVSAITMDVANAKAVADAFESMRDTPVDGLVTCAGVQSQTAILDLEPDEWDRVFSVNLRGTFLCVQNALRTMIPRGEGRIVTVASDTAKRGGGRLAKSAYSASKGGVLAFTRSIARELAAYKGSLRINCLNPGPMLTTMHDGITQDDIARVEGSVPLGRFGSPFEVAAGAMFLLSDEASYVYGETLCVDGGVIMD